jgi:hypothetical protein
MKVCDKLTGRNVRTCRSFPVSFENKRAKEDLGLLESRPGSGCITELAAGPDPHNV